MNQDKIEIISEQLCALNKLWNLLRASSLNQIDKDRCEELLLDVFETKQKELDNSIKA